MGILVQIGNLQTFESLNAQYAPTELTESYAVNYTKVQVPGLSHELLQFINCANAAVDLELDFNQLVNPKVPIAEQRKMLLAMMVPSKKATSIATGAPSSVLFNWPELFSMACKLTHVEFKHTLFAPSGASTLFRAKVKLEEARDVRLYAEDVRQYGTVRIN